MGSPGHERCITKASRDPMVDRAHHVILDQKTRYAGSSAGALFCLRKRTGAAGQSVFLLIRSCSSACLKGDPPAFEPPRCSPISSKSCAMDRSTFSFAIAHRQSLRSFLRFWRSQRQGGWRVADLSPSVSTACAAMPRQAAPDRPLASRWPRLGRRVGSICVRRQPLKFRPTPQAAVVTSPFNVSRSGTAINLTMPPNRCSRFPDVR